MATVLRCSGLRKAFGDRVAVDDVSFEIATGEVYGLLGPNGAGKTTTISLICGLLRRDAGTVAIVDRDLDGHGREARAAIGYVPQDLAIYPDLTAAENLRFFGRLQRMSGSTLEDRMTEVLEIIGLSDRRDDRTDSFSGGMKRRLNIGIGLLHEPELLILDEPTVGVDPQSRDAILASVERLGASGMGVLYTTHYMEEAERLCDRVGIIDRGSLIAEGSRRDLIAQVGDLDVLRLSVTEGAATLREALVKLPIVASVHAVDHTVSVELANAHASLPEVMETALRLDARIASVELVEPDLEAVFLHLTGRALRD